MKTYEEYKSSEIEWIGEIPTDWDVKKIKWMTSIKRGASPRPIDDPKYFDEDGEYAWVRIADVSNAGMYLEQTTQKMSELGASLSVKREPGDIFVSIAGTVGKPCITNIKCCIHDGFVYFPDYKGDKKYFYYIFESGAPYKGLGKMGTQLNLNTETIGSIKIPDIPSNLQTKIGLFIDGKVHEIDTLLDLKQKQIEKLEQQRQSIITEAVTKGLNPNVKMKDSGVEWIGEIPEHWIKTKFKYITNKIIDGTHSTPNYTEDGVPFLRVTDITQSKGKEIDLGNVKSISEEEHLELVKRCKPEKGDLLVSKNGTIGVPKVVNWDWEFSIFVSLCLIKLKKEKINPFYASYFFESDLVEEQITFGTKKSTIMNLHLEKVKEFFLFLPPIEEQLNIIEYLNEKTEEYSNLIYTQNRQVEKLKEYRQSLIYEAVTGKMDVREMEID